MKRKYVILIICVFFILCTGTVGSKSGSAWLNGKNDHAQTLINYKNDYSPTHLYTTTSSYYSTHDWIAECAIKLLYDWTGPYHKFIEMLYLNIKDMKMYFLLGTEAPDSITLKPSKWIDVVTSLRTITAVQVPTTKDHNLEFHPETRLLTKDNLADMAKRCQAKAEQMLGLYDCQAAAFYLGAMCHYIADAVFFPHLKEKYGTLNPGSGLDSSLKWRMHYLTSRKISDWQYCNGIYTEVGPFFNDTGVRNYWNWQIGYKYKSAWEATWWAAHHVCFGEGVSISVFNNNPDMDWPYRPFAKIDDAWEMNDYYDYYGDSMPPGFDIKTLQTVERRNDYWEHFEDSWHRNYLLALQFHLNLGVWYCAGVINHVKDSYTKCEEGISKTLQQTIEQLAVEYAFLWMMAGLGQFALFIVLAQTATSSFSGDKLSLLKALQYQRI